MTDPLETPEGQRIVEAMADVLLRRFDQVGVNPLDFLGGAGELAGECLRAALSVTGECKTCGGVGEVTTTKGATSKILGRVIQCPTCKGSGGEPLLVLREQEMP